MYKPENCKGEAQRILVAIVILQLMDWLNYSTALSQAGPKDDVATPDNFYVYVQGNPGSGKTFTTRTMMNIVWMVLGVAETVASFAPTGMAASLTRGTTTVCGMRLPCGSASTKPPQGLDMIKVDVIRAHLLFSPSSLPSSKMNTPWMDVISEHGWLTTAPKRDRNSQERKHEHRHTQVKTDSVNFR